MLIAVTVLGVLAILAIGAVLLRYVRMQELRTYRVGEEKLNQASMALLDYVETRTDAQGRVVDLQSFWKANPMGDGDKTLVLGPLLAKRRLTVSSRTTGQDWRDAFVGLVDWLLVPIPTKVALSEKEWHRRTHGDITVDARRIRQKIKNTGPGRIFAPAAFTDGDSIQQMGDSQEIQHGLSAQDFDRLAAVLRMDAHRLPEASGRPLLELADEAEAAKASPEPGRVSALLKQATTYTQLLSGGMTATTEFLKAIKHL